MHKLNIYQKNRKQVYIALRLRYFEHVYATCINMFVMKSSATKKKKIYEKLVYQVKRSREPADAAERTHTQKQTWMSNEYAANIYTLTIDEYFAMQSVHIWPDQPDIVHF